MKSFTRVLCATVVGSALLAMPAAAWAQTPRPFPRPDEPVRAPAPPRPAGAEPREADPGRPAQPTRPASPGATAADAASPGPTEAELGVPLYPTMNYLRSFDAGMGQRYHLFGTNTSYAQVVQYYRNVLKQRGDVVYDEPPVHMFEIGRFREETMAFPPGVTVKDYTWGGSQGYLHVSPAAPAARYATIVQIVPAVTTR